MSDTVAWALTADTGGHSQSMVLVNLALAESEGSASIGRQVLADRMNVSNRQVSRYLAQLVTQGLIQETHRGNRYTASTFLLMTPGGISNPSTHDIAVSPVESTHDIAVSPVESIESPLLPLASLSSSSSSVPPPGESKTPPPTSSLMWHDILRQDERWKDPKNGWIAHTEQAFEGVDLTAEAIAAIEWLGGDSARSRNIKTVTLFFTNWLKRAKERVRFAAEPQYQGRRASNAPATDEERRADRAKGFT